MTIISCHVIFNEYIFPFSMPQNSFLHNEPSTVDLFLVLLLLLLFLFHMNQSLTPITLHQTLHCHLLHLSLLIILLPLLLKCKIKTLTPCSHVQKLVFINIKFSLLQSLIIILNIPIINKLWIILSGFMPFKVNLTLSYKIKLGHLLHWLLMPTWLGVNGSSNISITLMAPFNITRHALLSRGSIKVKETISLTPSTLS